MLTETIDTQAKLIQLTGTSVD